MNTLNVSLSRRDLGFTGLILVSVSIGAGFAIADTFAVSGSTATIHQSGEAIIRTEVTRYKDGHRILTQDGNSTDVTIQRGSASAPSDDVSGYSDWCSDRFDRQGIANRFWNETDDDPGFAFSSGPEAFKQRMLQRRSERFRR